MAIKLSKDLKKETTNPQGTGTSNGFDIVGTPGVDYDIDKIVAGRNRKDSAAELLAELSGNGKTVGSVSISKEEERIFANNADAKRYLLKNEPSTDATNVATLRRPVFLFTEGTTDKNIEENNESLYDTIYKLQDEIVALRAELAKERAEKTDIIELFNSGNLKTDGTLIPTTQAIFDFIKKYVSVEGIYDEVIQMGDNYITTLSNSKLIENDENQSYFSLNLDEDYYEIVERDNENYTLIFGGKNG